MCGINGFNWQDSSIIKNMNQATKHRGPDDSDIFVDDFVDAFDLVLKKGKHLEIYNIGSDKQIKISDLALKVSKFLKKRIVLKKTRIARGSPKHRCPNIKKIKKLGFKQKYNMEYGLRKTISWYK